MASFQSKELHAFYTISTPVITTSIYEFGLNLQESSNLGLFSGAFTQNGHRRATQHK